MDYLEKWTIIRFTLHKIIHQFFLLILSGKYFFLLILFFKSSWRLISSAAFNRNNSVPQSASTTFALPSVRCFFFAVVRSRNIFPGAATCVPLLPRPLRGQGGHLLVLGGHAAQAEGSARRPPAGQTVHAHHPRI